ncbi:hypothetical protein GTW69_34725, partial [Streptomyces sp. SID7760]|nr:hypothetical protein [Streptomyces sp. SID7760]
VPELLARVAERLGTGGDAAALYLQLATLAAHAVRPLARNQMLGPFGRILPTAPLHEMFAAAWERESGEAAPHAT